MTYKDEIGKGKEEGINLGRALKKEMKSYYSLSRTVFDEGALSSKTKELIALGIAISEKCSPCILSHLENLVKLGATREEVSEAISVSIIMGGGPAVAYGGTALKAFDELTGQE